MKHLFIVNPTAGGKDKTEEVRAKAEAAFARREDPFEIYVTKAPMDATRKIQEEAGKVDHLRVYACGGDGTFNECVCGAALRSNVAVCPFPTGTGNDFCRMFGEEKELFRNLDALLEGEERPIDLLDCNGRYSANICSVGVDARIGTDVHKYSHIPLIGGATGYVVSAIVNMFKGIATPMDITCDDYAVSGKHTLICACNGRYYGGGFNPSLDARPDDGIMDVYIVKKVNLVQFAALIGKYAKGQADELPQFIKHIRSTGEVTIRCQKEDVAQLDGEALRAKEFHFRMVPRGLKLIVPKGMYFFEERKS